MLPFLGAAAGLTSDGAKEQVTFGAAGAGVTTLTGTLSVPYPTGIVAGSFLVLHTRTVSGEHATPSEWTRVPQLLAEIFAPTEGYYKVAAGSESGSLAIAISGDGDAIGRMYRFSHGSGIEAASDTSTVAGDTTIEPVNITTLGDKRMAVQLLFGIANTTIGEITGESGANYTEAVAEFTGASPINFCMSCQVAQVPNAAAITGGSATFGVDVDAQVVIGFAIVP